MSLSSNDFVCFLLLSFHETTFICSLEGHDLFSRLPCDAPSPYISDATSPESLSLSSDNSTTLTNYGNTTLGDFTDMRSAILLSFLGLAAAVPWNPSRDRLLPRDEQNQNAQRRRLLVGAPNKIFAVDFDPKKKGKEFEVVAFTEDLAGNPSWPYYNGHDTVYAFDESGTDVFVYNYIADNYKATFKRENLITNQGANGVVHLATSADTKRLLAASYGAGTIQVWNIEDPKNPKVLHNLGSNDGESAPDESGGESVPDENGGESAPDQNASQVHQVVMHPRENNFFVANDLGKDSLIVINGTNPAEYTIQGRVPVQAGCGPRHGVFHENNGKTVMFYTVVCEKSNMLLRYKVEVKEGGMKFTFQQAISTFDPEKPPVNITTAAAGAIAMDKNNHLLVSNRLTGGDTDSISVFKSEDGILAFQGEFSSMAKNPRMMEFSRDEDQSFLFVANIENAQGLHAFKWNDDKRGMTKVAHLDLRSYFGGNAENGPQFVSDMGVIPPAASASPPEDAEAASATASSSTAASPSPANDESE